MTAPALQVRAVTEVGAELDDLVPEWDALARRHGLGVACRPSCSLGWWTEHGTGRLELVTARRDGRLVAIAPLHRRRLLGRPVLRWLGHELGAVGELVTEEPDAASAVWGWLAERRSALQLRHVRLDDVGVLSLRRGQQLQVLLEVDQRCPVLELADGQQSADVRGARSLKRLAGYRGALVREGRSLEVRLVTDVEGLRACWPDLVRIAADADRAAGSRPNLCAPPYAGSTLRFLEQEARAGALVVVGALVGGRWAAHLVLLRSGRALVLWLVRTDPELGRYGLGHLLVQHVVDRHDELGVDRIDFGVGESTLTSPWANAAYDVATATAAPRRVGVAEARLGLASARLGTARTRRRRPEPTAR